MRLHLRLITLILSALLLQGCQSLGGLTQGEPMTDQASGESKAQTASDTPTNTQEPLECPKVQPVEKQCPAPKTIIKKINTSIEGKLLIGEVERVQLAPDGSSLDARIDTGATTTSIHALEIKGFERDGRQWVKYKSLGSDGKTYTEMSTKVHRTVQIKRHGSENQRRFVVMKNLTLGNITQQIEVTLTDREDFTYKILIGRNVLKDLYVVDVSQRFIADKPSE